MSADPPHPPDFSESPLHLFQGYGIEIEYIIASADDLSVLPMADQILHSVAGRFEAEVEMGALSWSNELALHLIELKTNGPCPALEELPAFFEQDVMRINQILQPMGAQLLPTGMHPWMDPGREMCLWPHEYNPVYETYNRIFDCKGHGWANLQSTHVNLSFCGDEEFRRLHAAVRLVLPLLPALAASSPVRDGRLTGLMDSRLDSYRTHVARVPSLVGKIVPDTAPSRSLYEAQILGAIYRDLLPHDPEGVLRHEWANARGAIARFDRSAIEIRLLDVQECPRADLAIAALASSAIEALTQERWLPLSEQEAFSTDELAALLQQTIAQAERTDLSSPTYRRALGWNSANSCSAGELWEHLASELWPAGSPRRREFGPTLQVIFEQGTLARRIAAALDGDPTRKQMEGVYRRLSQCLARGKSFVG